MTEGNRSLYPWVGFLVWGRSFSFTPSPISSTRKSREGVGITVSQKNPQQ